ncbi:hypothetical protein BKA82DRAFT_4015939 [Pisolithus tinctorius]|nr:hypothetical protein BKA82DRAFT_4015939 [Pisolithus tinctorius]
MLNVVQRHHDVLFYLGGITDRQNLLDISKRSGIVYIIQATLLHQGARDPSIYYKANIKGVWAIVDAAGVCRLIYTSSTSVVFNGTNAMNVKGWTSYSHKPFDTCNLLPYHSTMSSEPRLDPEGATVKLNESLHCVLPPICATTKCHHSVQTLSPYGTPPPNTGSILSTHNTPFDPHEPTGFVVHSRADEQASFITSGEQIYILEATELFDECE